MIKFREIKEMKDFESIVKWSSEEDSHLFVPSFIREKNGSVEDRWKVYGEPNKKTYLIDYKNKIVGEISYDLDFPHLYKKEKKTAWIGIVIGEKIARSVGIGKRAMEFLESISKKLGAERIELGCFEYNTKAYEFYLKMGYKEIGRIDKFTEYNGRWWQDIRMEKNFEQRDGK